MQPSSPVAATIICAAVVIPRKRTGMSFRVHAGKGGERGVARPEVLQELLGSCERVVQEIDSVEYGLTDIQEYYANTGALVAAAKNARKGKDVGCR